RRSRKSGGRAARGTALAATAAAASVFNAAVWASSEGRVGAVAAGWFAGAAASAAGASAWGRSRRRQKNSGRNRFMEVRAQASCAALSKPVPGPAGKSSAVSMAELAACPARGGMGMLAAMILPFALFESMPLWAWGAFFVFITAMLALDLGVLQRKPHEVSMKEAMIWCLVWIGLALGFNGLLLHWRGPELAGQFLAAYLVELCLSVDNVFIFILVFAYFKVGAKYQHRVLFWGIIGAVVMRAIFILVGV